MFAEHEQSEYNHSCFATMVILGHSKRPLRIVEVFYYGADNQIRTGDLVLTKDVLYQLSHISTHIKFCSHKHKSHMLIYYSKKVEECQTKYHGFAKIFFSK